MASKMSLEERIARQVLADEKVLAEKIDGAEEPRYGDKRITPDEELDFWAYEDTNLNVDRLRAEGLEAHLDDLKAVGVDPNAIDMNAYKRLVEAGTPDESWIKALRWPHQIRLMRSAGRVLSTEKQLAYVRRMNKRLADRAAERQASDETEVS